MSPLVLAVLGLLVVVVISLVQNTILEDYADAPSGHLFGYTEKLFQDDGSRLFNRRLDHPPVMMSGAPDFIVRDDHGEPVVLELKSGHRSDNQFEGHRMQVLMYLWILKQDFDEPVRRGELIYLEDDRPEGRVLIEMNATAEEEFINKVKELYRFWYDKREQTSTTAPGAGV